jgi:hypothetical protein
VRFRRIRGRRLHCRERRREPYRWSRTERNRSVPRAPTDWMSGSDAGGSACASADMRGSTIRKASRARGSLTLHILFSSSQGTKLTCFLQTVMQSFEKTGRSRCLACEYRAIKADRVTMLWATRQITKPFGVYGLAGCEVEDEYIAPHGRCRYQRLL